MVVLLKPVMPAMKTYREAVFSGWFGPMGVGAVFLSIIAKEELEHAYEGKEKPVSVELIAPVVLFIVFCSVLVHGTTIPLFKLGKRIRTRTLSISSVNSSQMLRLPKFGQQGNKRDHHDDSHDERCNMTELERNTLYNTIQHPTNPVFDIHTNKMHHGYDDSDIAEEDLLPDDSSGTLQNTSQIDSVLPKVVIPVPASDDPRRGSSHSADSTQQAIRFLEPVKPRIQNPQPSNAEKNEISVSSLKSWLLRHSDSEDEGSSSRGILNLFRKSKDVHKDEQQLPVTDSHQQELEDLFHQQSTQQLQPQLQHPPSINPNIEVWEEGNDIVVIDTNESEAKLVHKKEHPNDWKSKVHKKIKQLEADSTNAEKSSSSKN